MAASKHLFVRDETVPLTHDGRATCQCQRTGRPGDVRHLPVETIPLFPAPDPESLQPVRAPVQPGRPSWTKYTGKRVACDDCIVFLHENEGQGPQPRSARMVRTIRATGQALRLCPGHGEMRKEADQKAGLYRVRKGAA